MKIRNQFALLFLLSLTACSGVEVAEFVNPNKGKLTATVKLEEKLTKKFALDSSSAPRPVYTQIFTDSTGQRLFTFLNQYYGTIYCYNYETGQPVKQIKVGSHESQMKPLGYHIRTLDSIFIYNGANIELVLENREGEVKNKISLIGNRNIRKDKWMLTYPQYSIQTAIPFIEVPGALLLPGQFPNSIPDTVIDKFRFLSQIDLATGTVTCKYLYPKELYEKAQYNWPGQAFSEVFADLHADAEKIVFSFPVSHNLYVADLQSENYTTVYGGSNQAGTIHSVKSSNRKVPRALEAATFINNDMYGAVKYDKYRKVYYRLLRGAVPGDVIESAVKKKPAIVIILDEQFNYLGETNIGIWGDWNLRNFFVTQEGLNIEYIGENNDENFLTLKVFDIKKI